MTDLLIKVLAVGIGLNALRAVKNHFWGNRKVCDVSENTKLDEKASIEKSFDYEDSNTHDLNDNSDDFHSYGPSPSGHEFSEGSPCIRDEEGSVCRSLATCLSRTLSNLTEEEEIKLFLDQWEDGADSPTIYEDNLYLNESKKCSSGSPKCDDFDSEDKSILVESNLKALSQDKLGADQFDSIIRNALELYQQDEQEDKERIEESSFFQPNDLDEATNDSLSRDINFNNEQELEAFLTDFIDSSYSHNSFSNIPDHTDQLNYDDDFDKSHMDNGSLEPPYPHFSCFDSQIDPYSPFMEELDVVTVSEMTQLLEQDQQMENTEMELLYQLEMMDDSRTYSQKEDYMSENCIISFIEEEKEEDFFFFQLLDILDSSDHMVAEVDQLFHTDTIDEFLEKNDYFADFRDYNYEDESAELSVSYPPCWVDIVLLPSPSNSLSQIPDQLRKSNYSWSEEVTFMGEMRSKLKRISTSHKPIAFEKCQLLPCGWCGSVVDFNCCGWRAPSVYDEKMELLKTVSTPISL